GQFKAISADVRINPELSAFTWIEFYRAMEIIERGVEAAERALPDIKRQLAERIAAPAGAEAGDAVQEIVAEGRARGCGIVRRRGSAGRTANPDRPASQAHVRSRLVPDVAERELELEAIEEPRGHEDEDARDDASRGARVRPAAEGPRRHPGRRR